MAIATTARPMRRFHRGRRPAALLTGLAAIGVALVSAAGPAAAQGPQHWVGVPPAQQSSKATSSSTVLSQRRNDPTAQMLVQADEVNYDYTNERVSAVGRVRIYYGGSTLEADKVVYDQRAKRLRADGSVRLTEQDGKIVHADTLDLSDDYRDGFVDSLRLEAPDKTRFAAARADRSKGDTTVFQSGVYTACEPCKDDPKKPPKWQVRAARIIHNETEKMIYFEDARLEFFGLPMAWFPYFSTPDPTVKRKTGWLVPKVSTSSKYGVALETPYYWALAPDYDVTLTPMITSKQGLLLQGEWRQRLLNGSYAIRAAGIFQQDKDYFLREYGSATPGYRDLRGSIESSGQFRLAEKWVWGWDATLLTDRTFLQDYGLQKNELLRGENSFLKQSASEAISQIYLTGQGDRSYFDARVVHYFGLSESDIQNQLPTVHPVVDHNYIFAQPVFGGQLGYRLNLTSLSRSSADFDPITRTARTTGQCDAVTADPTVKSSLNCVLRGVPGHYTRFSSEVDWKRTFTDALGQRFTPFASLRADVSAYSIVNETGVSNFIADGDGSVVRVMPTVGVEYRYPFISLHSWGTQTLEPIAQLIVRPNESQIGKTPNEDAQSLVFDDSNLFKVDKFSGWDRTEGGGRANVGVQYGLQFNQAGYVSAVFGQSYHLFGVNSFAETTQTNTGLNSGLDKKRSDYVARLSYQPDRIYTFSTRARFDEDTWDARRFEVEGRANFDRWSASILYGSYDAQPEIGYLDSREGVLGTAAVKVTQNWTLLGGARYNISARHIDQLRAGVGYIDDCFAISVNYVVDYATSGNTQADQKILMQINLRTLGGTGFSQKVGTQN